MENKKLLDFELILRIKQGDKIAFELIFYLFHSQLRNYAKSYVKRSDIADELVQEVFIKLWESRNTLDEKLSVKGFLYKCVHNQCLNYIRNARVSRRMSEAYIQELRYIMQILEMDTSESWPDESEPENIEKQIHDIINDLPRQCREIFIMSRFNELSYQEIADNLLLSVNTVKTQIKRALQKIRSSLGIN